MPTNLEKADDLLRRAGSLLSASERYRVSADRRLEQSQKIRLRADQDLRKAKAVANAAERLNARASAILADLKDQE